MIALINTSINYKAEAEKISATFNYYQWLIDAKKECRIDLTLIELWKKITVNLPQK